MEYRHMEFYGQEPFETYSETKVSLPNNGCRIQGEQTYRHWILLK